MVNVNLYGLHAYNIDYAVSCTDQSHMHNTHYTLLLLLLLNTTYNLRSRPIQSNGSTQYQNGTFAVTLPRKIVYLSYYSWGQIHRKFETQKKATGHHTPFYKHGNTYPSNIICIGFILYVFNIIHYS